MDALTAAKSFATLHHVIRRGQMYGVVPYTHHLSDVERILREFDWEREELLVASWLHDVVEDTDVKLRDVEENFGEEVARLVGAVTSEDGPNRKVRNALTYPKIREGGVYAVALKLTDRLSNVRYGGASRKMYLKEYPDFRRALYLDNEGRPWAELRPMWDALDEVMGWPYGIVKYEEAK